MIIWFWCWLCFLSTNLHNCDRAIPNSISNSTLFLPNMYFSSLLSSIDRPFASNNGSLGVRDRRGADMEIRGASSLGKESRGAVRLSFKDGEEWFGFSCMDFLFVFRRLVLRIAESVSSVSSICERFVRDLVCTSPTLAGYNSDYCHATDNCMPNVG